MSNTRAVQHEGEGMYDDMRVDRDVMVPMRDGIKLACDVYRPAAAGQTVPGAFPVILERTPYGKGQTSRSEIARHSPERPQSRQEVAAFFVHHGYVVVYQDCRGRYGSEGVVGNTSPRRRTATILALGSCTSPGAMAASGPWACPMPPIPRWRLPASIRLAWRPCLWMRAALLTPIRVVFARAAPSSSGRPPGPTTMP